MITDQDITQLKGVFATKEDLERFSAVFATKEDLADVRLDIGDLRDIVEVQGEKIDHIATTMDRIAGNYEAMVVDNAVGANVLGRHTRQIEVLAKHTGAQLPD